MDPTDAVPYASTLLICTYFSEVLLNRIKVLQKLEEIESLKYKRVSVFITISATLVFTVSFDAFLQDVPGQFTVLQKTPDNWLKSWTSTASLYENKTHTGDIIVENGTYLVENMEFHIVGKMSVRNDAAVIVRNAKLVLSRVWYIEAIEFKNKSKFMAENATIVFQLSIGPYPSYIIADHESQLNITDSKLSGWGGIIARNDSKVYIENGTFEGPNPRDDEDCVVITKDNSFASIQNSKLDSASARGQSSILVMQSVIQPNGVSAIENGTIEIENSDLGYCQWLLEHSNLRMSNSTVEGISFGGSILQAQNSRINGLRTSVNCNVILIDTPVSYVKAHGNSTVWLINSVAREIKTWDEAKVNVGWQLPVLGVLTVPYTWIPILKVVFVIALLIVVIAAAVLLNRRWKRWQTEKMKQEAISACNLPSFSSS
jgi:hypothetical protein